MIIQGERGNGVVDSVYGSIPDVVLPSQFFELAGPGTGQVNNV